MQWLSFDEPESRLRKALKRDGFFTDDLHNFAGEQTAQSFAALAFALADIEIFNTISFKNIAKVLAASKELNAFNAKESLNKIHHQLFSHLEREIGLPAGEIIWAALTAEFLAQALKEREDLENSEDLRSQTDAGEIGSISFLTNVKNRIAAAHDFSSAIECGALVELATRIFKDHLDEMRSQLPPDFLPERLLIVEGQTEAILIPHFALLSDFQISEKRILMLSGGGANQVAKRFLALRETTNLPIACLLDGDAESQYEIISQHKHAGDLLFSLPSGEIEDTFEISRFVQFLNRYLQSMTGENAPSLIEFEPIKKDQFAAGQRRTQVLNKIWKEKSLGNFDKVEFAGFVAETMKSKEEIPRDFSSMIEIMKVTWGEN